MPGQTIDSVKLHPAQHDQDFSSGEGRPLRFHCHPLLESNLGKYGIICVRRSPFSANTTLSVFSRNEFGEDTLLWVPGQSLQVNNVGVLHNEN